MPFYNGEDHHQGGNIRTLHPPAPPPRILQRLDDCRAQITAMALDDAIARRLGYITECGCPGDRLCPQCRQDQNLTAEYEMIKVFLGGAA